MFFRFLVGASLVCALAQTPHRKVSDAEVERVQRSALLIDTHNDITSMTVDGFDIGSQGGKTMTDIARMKAGGMGAQFFAVYVSKDYVKTNQSAHRALEMIDTVRHDIIDRYPNDFALALTADDIERIHRSGKIAALLGIEGGHAIEDSLRLLRDYYLLGVRYMTLTHTNTNGWADSSGDTDDPTVKHHGGLTPFGKQVVAEMNRLGMMVDISHTADATFWDVISTSTAPPMASHSSCRALDNVPRNMTDQMIAALAKKGGVIQINFACEFLTQAAADKGVAFWPKLEDPKLTDDEKKTLYAQYMSSFPRPTVEDVADHIDHAVKVGGIDAVGLGSDFDGITCAPKDLDEVSKWPNLTRVLLERGYSPEDIRKIYGGNLLRVMRAVEAESRRLQAEAR